MKKLFFLSLLLLSLHSFSQPLSKGEFRKMFTQGNLMMLEKYYDTACKVFLKLNSEDPSNANVNYKIGICYLNIPGEKLKAIPYLENALKQTSGNYREDDASEKNAPEDVLYYLGQAYHYGYRFDEATAHYNKFREIIGKWNLNYVKEIDQHIETSKNGKELFAKPVECTITNLGDSVNCPFPDYSPVISADESILAFTSRRLGTGGALNKTMNDEFLEDIWLCNRGPYGTWTKAKGISRTINTESNEATIGLSADGQELYVYRDDGKGDGNIYLSTQDGDYWNAPSKVDAGLVNSDHWEPSACVSADGKTMYFVSDRPGGLGGRDIYLSKKLANNTWGEPENLGPTINTPRDEDGPFMHPDGTTFFFSSKGHTSMGGFDVFYSTKVANNVWTKPINMGYPINTTDDDIYFVCSSDGRRAYYASFRPEGKGEKDIYMVSMPKAFVKSVAILVAYLKNRDGSPIPKNSQITTRSSKGEIISSRANEANGKFIQSLFPGQEYEISIEANGNKVFSDKFFLPEDSSYQNLGRGFFQRTIYLGDTTKLFSQNKVTDTTSKKASVLMDGKILLSQDPADVAKNVSIQLLNSQGNIIASAVTNSEGQFNFQNIPADQRYMIKINENDPILKTNNQFFLANNDGKVILPSTQEGKFFLFKNLSPELNKLSALEAADTTLTTASMKGLILNSVKNGLAGVQVKLSGSNGKIIQTAKTNESGMFTFKRIPVDANYTLQLDEADPAVAALNKVYLANETSKAVKIADPNKLFKNLPADLMKLEELKETYLSSQSNDAVNTIVHKTPMYPGDENFDFVVYFPYNKKEIDISVGSFLSLMEKVAKMIKENGSARIIIAASSSSVPTRSFPSNEALAESRANEIKDKVRASISLQNLDDSKLSYDISAKVLGPAYKNDAVQNRKEYEKWQFVKVIVK